MQVTVIGTGFVGVVTAAVLASFGHEVIGLDVDPAKVKALTQGEVPFFEPNLEELLKNQLAAGHLTFTTDYATAIPEADVILIAVGTPSQADGQADLKYVFAASESLAPHLKSEAIVVIKSTVPPGTLAKVNAVISPLAKNKFYTASVPEFLREGSAVDDTLHPDRIIIGTNDDFVFNALETLHRPLNAPILRVTPESAQMAKYASNAYLATRITFINQMADLCQINGADVQEVIKAIGQDQRIGQHYWYPGFGYGGSCFPKDVRELAAYSRSVGEANNLFNKINELNDARIERLMQYYDQAVGGFGQKKVAVLGLSFKPNTDDMREAPSMKVIPWLLEHGATVTGFDPKAKYPAVQGFTQTNNLSTALDSVQVIMVLIEWSEIISFDFAKNKPSTCEHFIDARNQFDPKSLKNAGYNYLGVGR